MKPLLALLTLFVFQEQDLMPDALHLSEKAYPIWADTTAPLLQELLGK